jgi:hypothetical protein
MASHGEKVHCKKIHHDRKVYFMKKLTLPVTSGMRFDIWLKRSRENSSPLLQFSAGGKLSMR